MTQKTFASVQDATQRSTKDEMSYLNATGRIRFNMTNDYMFHYILQENEPVLRGLVGAVMHLKPEEIKEIAVMNPIAPSENIEGKGHILDIKVLLNNNEIVHLEMQNVNQYNWEDRSLLYLCRAFDRLAKGQEYEETRPVTQIGFLDFTLFPDEPEFYATNMLMNIKTHRIYNSKFKLSVVNLTQTELATAEDREWRIDYWARLFKAKTWEDLKMLAEKNQEMQKAAQALYVANADDIIQDRCLAQEDAKRFELIKQNKMKKLQEQLDEKDAQLDEKDAQLAAQLVRIAELEAQLKKLN